MLLLAHHFPELLVAASISAQGQHVPGRRYVKNITQTMRIVESSLGHFKLFTFSVHFLEESTSESERGVVASKVD